MRPIDADALEKLIQSARMKMKPECYSSMTEYNTRDTMLLGLQQVIHFAPTITTKQVKYYDEDEKVWKIGSVIVDE